MGGHKTGIREGLALVHEVGPFFFLQELGDEFPVLDDGDHLVGKIKLGKKIVGPAHIERGVPIDVCHGGIGTAREEEARRVQISVLGGAAQCGDAVPIGPIDLMMWIMPQKALQNGCFIMGLLCSKDDGWSPKVAALFRVIGAVCQKDIDQIDMLLVLKLG